MNIRDLRYAIALAEYRHFNKAADVCFVSQPTLSGQIKKLEDELGVMLFERSKRSVKITPIGKKIVAHAKRVMDEIEIIESVAKIAQDPFAQPLRLGIIPTLAPFLLPLILGPLSENYPQFQLIIREEVTESLLAKLHSHELDAILIATEPEKEFFTKPLFDEPFWLAHPTRHPLHDKAKITAEDLKQDELLLLTDGHCLSDQVSFACQFSQNQTGNDLRASSLETLMQLVGAGFGYTLVPALALNSAWAHDSGLVIRKIDIPDAMRQIRLVTRKTFTRMQILNAIAQHILTRLPNTVNILVN